MKYLVIRRVLEPVMLFRVIRDEGQKYRCFLQIESLHRRSKVFETRDQSSMVLEVFTAVRLHL